MSFLSKLQNIIFGPPSKRAKTCFDMGMKELQRNRHSIAEFHFKKAALLAPESAEYRVAYGNVLMMKGELESALREYQTAEDTGNRSEILFSNWGVVLRMLGRPEEALKKHLEALKITPTSVSAIMNASVCMMDLKREEEAKGLWLKVIELEPLHAAANANLAQVTDPEKEEEKFLLYIQRAEEGSFDNAGSRFLKAAWLLGKGRTLESDEVLQATLDSTNGKLCEALMEDARYSALKQRPPYTTYLETKSPQMYACTAEGLSGENMQGCPPGEHHHLVVLAYTKFASDARPIAEATAAKAGWNNFEVKAIAPADKRGLVGKGMAAQRGWAQAEQDGAHIFVF